MLQVRPIFAGARFHVLIDCEAPTIAPILDDEIEALWQAEGKGRAGKLFNGAIVSAVQVGDDCIHACSVEYRRYIAQRARPDLFDALQVRPVAVSGLLECADGLVFGRRARAVTQDAGQWELVPSGGLDASRSTASGEVNLHAQLLLELQEETGLASASVVPAVPFCLIEDPTSHVLDIGIALKTPMTAAEILAIHGKTPKQEYDMLRVVQLSEVPQFTQVQASRLASTSLAMLQEFHRQSQTSSGTGK